MDSPPSFDMETAPTSSLASPDTEEMVDILAEVGGDATAGEEGGEDSGRAAGGEDSGGATGGEGEEGSSGAAGGEGGEEGSSGAASPAGFEDLFDPGPLEIQQPTADICGLFGCILSRVHSGMCEVPPQPRGRDRRPAKVYDAEPAPAPRVLAAAARAAAPPRKKPLSAGQAAAGRPKAKRAAVVRQPSASRSLICSKGCGRTFGHIPAIKQHEKHCHGTGSARDGRGATQAGEGSTSGSSELPPMDELMEPTPVAPALEPGAQEGAGAGAMASEVVPPTMATEAAVAAPRPRAAPRPPRPKREPAAGGGRSGTRSAGEPAWMMSEREVLELSALEAGLAPQKQSREQKQLRDFLSKGKGDPFANGTWTSIESDKYDAASAERGIRWGCQCEGHKKSGGVEMACKGCGLYFHSVCERLGLSGTELQVALAKQGGYECMKCEELRLKELGLENGKFAFQCRFCGRTFDNERAAHSHGQRCGSLQLRRQWNCPCNGERGSAAALQCKQCAGWFHRSCKNAKRAAWEVPSGGDALCGACEMASATEVAPRGNDRVARRAQLAADQEQKLEELLVPRGEEQLGGSLQDGRVYVAASQLGAAAGLGLFAGVAYQRNDAITCYSGPLLYREQISADADTSYILRLPNSGGKHIDGKPYADSIRSNPLNPGKDGRHYPAEGAKEWKAGAASMSNDPRQQQVYNARITFRKPQGASKALCELVPMRAVLLATRDIAPDEEAPTPPLPRSPTHQPDSHHTPLIS